MLGRVSPQMRKIRNDRMDRAMSVDMERKREEDKKKRLNRDYEEMQRVLDFFYDNCPCELEENEKQLVEKQLFNGKGSRSKCGTIMFLMKIIGERWPEWEQVAKKEFSINY